MNEAKLAEIRNWLIKARHDLGSARRLMEGDEPYCSLCHTPTRLLWKASTELLTGTSARKTGIRSALFFAGC